MNGRIDKLNKQLQAIKESFDLWKNSGLNEEILIIYLARECKMGERTIRKILEKQQEFFDKLIKEETVKRLTK